MRPAIFAPRFLLSAILIGSGATAVLGAETGAASGGGLLSLEELGRIQIVTVSKNPQPAWTSPSALAVITDDDLRWAGINSIPQALRLAPGADVAQVNSQRHAVSIRGFNGEYANKLLVLQDGRSLFNAQFLGVFWDAQDVVFEDVDRIEVVRGPGGTAWGANAVNGVVNIITKPARETQGALVQSGFGIFDRAFGVVRYGGQAGIGTHYRVYAKGVNRGETERADGMGVGDDWTQWRAGFRVDSTLTSGSRLTLQGDGYTARLLQYANRLPDDFLASGGNVLGRLVTLLPDRSELNLVTYVDVVRRHSAPATANSDTFATEAHHQWRASAAHRLEWNAGFQFVRNEAIGGTGHNYDPAIRRLRYWNLTLADEYAAIPKLLAVSAGAKLERNPFTGWEVLPTARATWTPSERKTGWLALSRGLQTPALSDYDLTHDIPGPVRVVSLPSRNRPAGEVVAAEVGWRVEPSRTLSFDASTFFNRYDRLASTETTFDPRTSTSTTIRTNDLFGESWGAELASIWEPQRRWRLRASYSLLRVDLDLQTSRADAVAAERQAGASPRHQWQLVSMAGLGPRSDFTVWLRRQTSRSAIGIPAYTGLDLRWAYRCTGEVEVAVAGRDLLDPRHPEFTRSPGFPATSEIPRRVAFEIKWTH